MQITLKVSDKSENCCRQSLILSRRDVFIMEKAPELTNLNGTKARNESWKIYRCRKTGGYFCYYKSFVGSEMRNFAALSDLFGWKMLFTAMQN